jgi:hypothetical protein
MQIKKNANAKKILDSIIAYKNLKNYAELAAFVGVAPSTISTWIARGSVDVDKLFRLCEGISFDYLLTGEGPMFDPATRTLPPSITLTGNGSIQAGRNISGIVQENLKNDEFSLTLDPEEALLIKRLREFGGKKMLRKFLASLDRLEGEFSCE